MIQKTEEIRAAVREQVAQFAAACRGCSTADIVFGDDDRLGERGLLDSAATIELVLYIEAHFLGGSEMLDLTASNFGTVNQITATIEASQAQMRAKAA